MKHRIRILLAALWWGSLTGLGFVVVPMLFMNLGNPAIAGGMAAKLFTAQTWLSAGCAMVLLLAMNRQGTQEALPVPRLTTGLVVAGLLLALLVEFGIAPRIVGARGSGGNLKLWHGLGTAMYLVQWLCAGAALWRLAKRSDPA